jgi:hypothetical protein
MIDRILIVLCGAALALGATACQDIIFPPNGNGGGNGSGGNGRPDTVVSSKDTLFLEGTVVSDGSALPLTLPRDAKVALVWRQHNGTVRVLGVGEIDRLNYKWRISINGKLPESEMYMEYDGRSVYGLANIVLLNGPAVADGLVLQGEDPSVWPVKVLGMSHLCQVVYDTDQRSNDLTSQEYLQYFPAGYSVSVFVTEPDPSGMLRGKLVRRPGGSNRVEVVAGQATITNF